MPDLTPTSNSNASLPEAGRVFVWDIPVRLFHWTLLALMVALFVTAEILDGAIELHATLGRAVLALVLFRLLWGVAGSSYARFSQFVRGPETVMAYVRTLLARQAGFIAGHNPLGGWMVMTLLVTVMLQAVLGLFANDDILFEGPFAYLVSKDTSDLISGLHQDMFTVLLVLVGLHVAAVIWHKLFKGENLLPAMFSGYKELPTGAEAENAHGGGLLLAITLLAICVLAVYWLTA